MEPQTTSEPSTLRELLLWGLAGFFMTAAAVAGMAGAHLVLGWNESQWVVASIAVGAASLTWGSWASLLWTRSRVLKILMVAVVVIPGTVMAIAGGWAFFNVPDNRWIWRWGWLIVCGHGLGSIAVAVFVCARRFMGAKTADWNRSGRLKLGWTVFPLALVAGSAAIAAVTFVLMPDVFTGGDGTIEMLVRWIVPSQAVVLMSTILPAGLADLCDRLTRTAIR